MIDAESLAEKGVGKAYQSMLPKLRQYVSQPMDIQEIIDDAAPRYVVKHGIQTYIIYSPELNDKDGQSWARATYAFFKIINDQMASSDHRFYAINGGDDLFGIFLTEKECIAARQTQSRKNDWPYLPTPAHPWYGQFHN
jgi:hypothetical protein